MFPEELQHQHQHQQRFVANHEENGQQQVQQPPQNWNSWLNQKGRRRNPLRLSISVDSIHCADNDFLSSSLGSLTNPDCEEDDERSVNNILDAVVGGSGGSCSAIVDEGISSSWMVLDSASASAASTSTTPPSSSSMKKKYPPRPRPKPKPKPKPRILPPETTTPNSFIHNSGGEENQNGIGKPGIQLINNNNSTMANTNTNANSVEEYEHVYCQLDPYFTPPVGVNLAKSQPITSISLNPSTRFNTRSSLRSWGRFGGSGTMEREQSVIPMFQQALVVRYREMLDQHLEAPLWYRQHMGTTDLEEIVPIVYQSIPSQLPSPTTTTTTGIYGTNSKKQGSTGSSSAGQEQFRPVLPHQIFSKMSPDDSTRGFWLEGEAGSGKTLLCLKLIQEWTSYHSFGEPSPNNRLGEFQILLYIPLREVRRSLTRFILRELIPKHSYLSRIKPANVLKFLTLLGSSMLIILDGLDAVTDEGLLKEIQDVLNGLLFPQALVLLTSKVKVNKGLGRGPAHALRKYRVDGMDWTQIQCSIRRYFTGRKFGNESRLGEILTDRPDLCALASNPFMCLLLCSVFEEVGDVPCSTAEFYSALVRSLIFQNGLTDKPTTTIPAKYQKILEDFGKLTLRTLGENRVHYTEAEIEEACGNLDILKTGLLFKASPIFRKVFPKKSSAATFPLSILHPALNTFSAAFYLVNKVTPGRELLKELELLPGIEDLVDQGQVKDSKVAFIVASLVMELLQQKSSSLLNSLTLLDISVNYLLALLRSAGFYESNLNAVCSVLSSMRHVTISVATEWVSEWKQVLSSAQCPFDSIEIQIKPGYPLSRLTEGLCLNESISSVKFSSVPGQDWNAVEVNLVCGQLLRLLSEKTLKCLEVSITCLEDKEHSKFQPFVDVFCFVLSRRVPLKKLVLDMDLTSAQLVQLTAYIRGHEHLEVFHVPHLGCGPEGFRALSDLLLDKPLLSLSVAGSWRSNSADVEEDVVVFESSYPPYSQSPGPGPIIPGLLKSQHSGSSLFSSLPRGPLGRVGVNGNGSIKSPSIRRKRIAHAAHGPHLTQSDKRNSDTALFQRNFLPLPLCDRENHEVDGFHAIFSVLRLRDCRLKALNLSKCVMNWEDVICLGESIRRTTSLDSLRMEGMKLCDVLPVLLALQENSSLKMLDLSSPHVMIGDEALQLVANSLGRNSTLRLLAIQGWNIYIEEEQSLESLEILFRSSNLQDLDLTNVRIQVNTAANAKKKVPEKASPGGQSSPMSTTSGSSNGGKKDSISSVMSLIGSKNGSGGLANGGASSLICRSLSFLRLRGATVEINKGQSWRSLDILTHLTPRLDKDCLTLLDISLDSKDPTPPIHEKILLKTLKIISQNFPKLQTLIMANWKVRVTSERSLPKEIGKLLSAMTSLSTLQFDHSTILTPDPGDAKRLDHLMILVFLTHLKGLTELSWAGLDVSNPGHLCKAIMSANQGKLILKLDLVPLHDTKRLIGLVKGQQSTSSNNGGVGIEYSHGNSICVTRAGLKNEHLINKLKRFL